MGGGFSRINGNRHAFSLEDQTISYPYRPTDTVTTAVLFVVSLIVPAIIIVIICLLLVPGPTTATATPKSRIWRRKLWEWNTGWLGLALALASAFFVTQGLKDLLGKNRPDFIARCQPDVAHVAQYAVGGLGLSYGEAPVVVDWHICRTTDVETLRDGFASFPSGHSSFSFAGLTYLTLFLCAKFAISIPFLAPAAYNRRTTPAFRDIHHPKGAGSTDRTFTEEVAPRNQAAAPPVYLLILAFVPIATAFFISASRWSDYRHHGFDIIAGAFIGLFFAWFAFRWYHLPIRRGAGWSWGPRSRDRAYYTGLGVPSYVGDEGWDSAKTSGRLRQDLDAGNHPLDDLESHGNIMGAAVRDYPDDHALGPNSHPNHGTGGGRI